MLANNLFVGLVGLDGTNHIVEGINERQLMDARFEQLWNKQKKLVFVVLPNHGVDGLGDECHDGIALAPLVL